MPTAGIATERAPWLTLPAVNDVLSVGSEVREGLASGEPVVALESTIFSQLGLPTPANRECYGRVVAAIRAEGAVPALCGVVEGRGVVGATEQQAGRLFDATTKIAARDLGPAIARRLASGATTVSATLTLAAAAGIDVFATGGIGGVHRGVSVSGDVSHDLQALARHQLVVVSSGPKAFLDARLTLEYLETQGVAVLGWRTQKFPAFYVRDSGLGLATTVQSALEVARSLDAARSLGHPGGILVANPIPPEAELDPALLERAIAAADEVVQHDDVIGGAVTPVVLDSIAAFTGGASVRANLALAQSNASVAAEIAVALAADRVGAG